jgi:hypothetical protein
LRHVLRHLHVSFSHLHHLCSVTVAPATSKGTFTPCPLRHHPPSTTNSHYSTMPRLANDKKDILSKSSLIKPPTKHNSSISKPSPRASPRPSQQPNASERGSSISPAQRKLSITTHTTPRKHCVIPAKTQPRKASATPKPPSPPKLSATPQATPRKPSATPQPRKSSATRKPASPPKPDWIPPPGKHCTPSLSLSSSPSQIPLPTFVSSARKENSPVPPRRKSGVVRSSPLSRWIGDDEDAASVTTDGDRSGGVRLSVRAGGNERAKEEEKEDQEKKRQKKEVRGLGLSFKDPFSSTPGSGLGFEYGYGSFSAPATLAGGGVDASPTSPASPASPSQLDPSVAATKDKNQGSENTTEEMSKRDSLSPTSTSASILSPTSIPLFPSSIPIAPRKHISKLLHLSSPRRSLPPSPSTTHPYTGNTHITPSCTSGSLTHLLECGHLVLTERVEVCGRNCGDMETRGGEVKGREVERGFRPNMRDLDARWLCPCCGIEREKGKRCVYVLGVVC